MYSIHNLFRQVLTAACPLCGLTAGAGDLCAGCLRDVLRLYQDGRWCAQCAVSISCAARLCAQCLYTRPAFDQTVAAIDYAYPGAMLIRGLKERGQLAQANMFARLLARTIKAHPQSLPRLNALVPIPSSAASLRKRGFNPAAEIARALRPALRVPLQQSWLRRTRESDLQKTLDFEARRKSVQGLYVCDQVVPPIWIGVVDDVLTSGSTMHEASLALKRAGALGVVALVAARATW